MVRFIHPRVCIQPWVSHNPIDEIINNGGDVVYATEPIVEGGFVLRLHGSPPFEASLSDLPLSPAERLENKNNRWRAPMPPAKTRCSRPKKGASFREDYPSRQFVISGNPRPISAAQPL